jgi:hypothetical protein
VPLAVLEPLHEPRRVVRLVGAAELEEPAVRPVV